MMRFELFKGNDGQFYFHLKGGNGQRIAQSEGYSRKESALHTIQSIEKEVPTAEIVDRTKIK